MQKMHLSARNQSAATTSPPKLLHWSISKQPMLQTNKRNLNSYLVTFANFRLDILVVLRRTLLQGIFRGHSNVPQCPKMFGNKDHINEHVRKTHSKSRRKCPHCGLAPAIYNSHVVNTKCLKCLKPFKCFALMKKHTKVCKLAFHCDFCDKAFTMESSLMNHFKAVHRKFNKNVWLGAKKHKESAFKCEPCKIYFAHEGFLNAHLRYFHIDRKTCTCHVCGKLVRCKSRMEYHLVHVHRVGKRTSSLFKKAWLYLEMNDHKKWEISRYECVGHFS